MAGCEFTVADAGADRQALVALNVEYLSWVFAGVERLFGVPVDQIVGMPVSEYVPSVIDKVCGDRPPKGLFYLVRIDGELAGMGGLRALGVDAAEIKRIYFRPSFRGRRLGDVMLDRLLADARRFGYRRACLDSAPFMTTAHRLYERSGFTDCPVYEGAEVPPAFHARWRFMERAL